MPSKPSHVDATPGVRPVETASQNSVSPDTPTLRLIHARYTVDILPALVEPGSIEVIVSTGELGTSPATVTVPIGLVALLVEAATVVRERRVIDTAAWSSPAVELTPRSERNES